jgi:hypothetical protein
MNTYRDDRGDWKENVNEQDEVECKCQKEITLR